MIDYTAALFPLKQMRKWKELTNKCAALTLIPNRAQFDVIRAIGNLTETLKKIFLITSANGTGKTTTMVNVLANLIWPGSSTYTYAKDLDTGEVFMGFYDHPLFKEPWNPRWPKVIWCVAHQEGINTIVEAIRKWWPKNRWAYTEFKEGKVSVAKIVTDNGFILYFKTTNMEKRAFEGRNVTIVWFDEPPKKWQYNAGIKRIRNGGFIVITATPVFEAGWFVDTIVEKIDQEEATGGQSDKLHFKVPIFQNSIEAILYSDLGIEGAMRVGLRSNGIKKGGGEWDMGIFGIQKKGNLEKAEVLFQIRNCDEEEAPARLLGEFVSLSGLVYKIYDIMVHRKHLTWTQPRKYYMYRCIVDPHSRLPPAITWSRIDPSSQRYYFREWPSPVHDSLFDGKLFYQIKDIGQYTIKNIVEFMIEIEEEWDIPLNRLKRIMDPNYAKIKNDDTGLEVHETYIKWSKIVYASRKKYPENTKMKFITTVKDDIYPGHAEVRQALALRHDGQPGIIIDPDCKNIDLSMRRYAWKEHLGRSAEEDSPSERLQQLHKHFPDLVRYDAALKFRYVPLESAESAWREDYMEEDRTASRDWRKIILAKQPEGDAGA